ncbi:MAG TPA: DUF3043 domain-containing protein [Streptosporangiaceae bacterium]|nr:DUF3043 domain-containing protein [Streptosporangiaceae bacterium]
MFRRRQPTTADSPTEDAAAAPGADAAAVRPGTTASKGRPTPKRSESERRRRPFNAPGDRKEANRQYRDRQRQERTRRMQGVQRGEQWALPPRDRGPVKALARDYVDSRRRLSEFYMYGLLVLLALLFVRNALVQSIVPLLVLIAVMIMLVEGIFIGRRVRTLAEERLPGESTRGVRLYAAMRALQIRRLRMPKPRIKPGESF